VRALHWVRDCGTDRRLPRDGGGGKAPTFISWPLIEVSELGAGIVMELKVVSNSELVSHNAFYRVKVHALTC
jgi:hypothetical protein